MVWNTLKRWFGSKPEAVPPAASPQADGPHWIEAADNPWGVRVLDVRPVSQTMLSTSRDPQCAANAVSFGQDDGSGFIGAAPPVLRIIETSLRFPVDGPLADGPLFTPRVMEHKWAVFHHAGKIIGVRSWLRKVMIVGQLSAHADHVEVTHLHGAFPEDEDPAFTIRMFDCLLRTHALDEVYPAPLPPELAEDAQSAALWCFSLFGNRVSFATADAFERREPGRALRVQTL